MQFVWLNKQGVASDQGFVVQRVERFVVEYREANRTMRLEGESIVGGLEPGQFGFGFYHTWRYAQWESPYCGFSISDRDRERIVQNIKDAMAFMGGKVEFDER